MACYLFSGQSQGPNDPDYRSTRPGMSGSPVRSKPGRRRPARAYSPARNARAYWKLLRTRSCPCVQAAPASSGTLCSIDRPCRRIRQRNGEGRLILTAACPWSESDQRRDRQSAGTARQPPAYIDFLEVAGIPTLPLAHRDQARCVSSPPPHTACGWRGGCP